MTELSAQPNIRFGGLSRAERGGRISPMAKAGPHRLKKKALPPQWRKNHVKEWRIFREMTVAELAEKAEMSTGNISALENHRQGHSAEGLEKLAKALKTTASALLDVDPLAEGTSDFWPLWEKASAEDREALTLMASRLVKRP